MFELLKAWSEEARARSLEVRRERSQVTTGQLQAIQSTAERVRRKVSEAYDEGLIKTTREIVIKRAGAREALKALIKAFPGHPWYQLYYGKKIVVAGKDAAERVQEALTKEDAGHPFRGNQYTDIAGGPIGNLERHTAMRDYTPKELDWEYNREYMVYAKPSFPSAFSSREDFQRQYDAAPLVHLDEGQLRSLNNSMAATGLGKNEAWVHSTFGHRRDTGRILTAMKEGKTAPPIVLKNGNSMFLMAGQTRLAAGMALGRSIPVKLIDVSKSKVVKEAAGHPFRGNQYVDVGGSQERIQSPAVSFDGQVFEGLDHADALDIASRKLKQSFNSLADRISDNVHDKAAQDGFTTTSGRFVSRTEAMQIAQAAGQLDESPVYRPGGRLDSAFLKQLLLKRALLKEFNPADHPRAPKGSPDGGQFVAGGAGGVSNEQVTSLLSSVDSAPVIYTAASKVTLPNGYTSYFSGKSAQAALTAGFGTFGTGPRKIELGTLPVHAAPKGAANWEGIGYYAPGQDPIQNFTSHGIAYNDLPSKPEPNANENTVHNSIVDAAASMDHVIDFTSLAAAKVHLYGPDYGKTVLFTAPSGMEALENVRNAGWHAGNFGNVEVGTVDKAKGDFKSLGFINSTALVQFYPSVGKGPGLGSVPKSPGTFPPATPDQYHTIASATTTVKSALLNNPAYVAAVAIVPWSKTGKGADQYYTGNKLLDAMDAAHEAGWHASNMTDVKIGIVPKQVANWQDPGFISYGKLESSAAVDAFPSGKNKGVTDMPKLQNQPQEPTEPKVVEAKPPPPATPDKVYDKSIELGHIDKIVDYGKPTSKGAHWVVVRGMSDDGKTHFSYGYDTESAVNQLRYHQTSLFQSNLKGPLEIGIGPINVKNPGDQFISYGKLSPEFTNRLLAPQDTDPAKHIVTSRERTGPEQSSVDAYADGAYSGINKYLSGRLDTANYHADKVPYIEKHINNLDVLFDTSKTNKDLTLIRGAKDYHLPKGLKVGSSFVNPAYSSSSTVRSTASGFGSGVLLNIKVPAGSRAILANQGEREVVLPRNGRFTVTSYRQEGSNKYYDLTFEDTHDKNFYHPASIKQMTAIEPKPIATVTTIEPVEPPKPKPFKSTIWDYAQKRRKINSDTGGDLLRFDWGAQELGDMMRFGAVYDLMKKAVYIRKLLAKEFDESKHPRVPKGSPGGGEFTAGGAGSGAQDGRDKTGPLKSGAFHISDKDKAEIKALLKAGTTGEEIEQHPAIAAARAYAAALPLTENMPGYGTPAFRANRQFKGGIIGYQAASDDLIHRALRYSKGPVRTNREATIILGPPASGKSGFAERIAASEHAALVDPDDAKAMFREFRGGIGANAVHEESTVLARSVLTRVMTRGMNLVLPKVGGDANSIKKAADTLRAAGYTVNLVNMEVGEHEVVRRSIGRFLERGRLISSDYAHEVDGNPTRTYNTLKGQGFKQVVSIDNNPPPGQYVVKEGADTHIGRALSRPRR